MGFDEVTVWTVSLIGITLTFMYWRAHKVKYRLPPGPPAVPVLGSLPFLGTKDLFVAFSNLRKRYGDVFTVHIGRRKLVVLNGYKTIKEALVTNGHAFSGRLKDSPLHDFLFQGNGILTTEGETTSIQRKFTLSVLREFGVGRPLLEHKIVEEVDKLLEYLAQYEGKSKNISLIIRNAVSNIISAFIFGKAFPYDDPSLKKYTAVLNEMILMMGNKSPLMNFPWIRHLPLDLFGVKKFLKNYKNMLEMFQGEIDKHHQSLNLGETHNFIDAYLQQIKKDSGEHFHNGHLVSLVSTFFLAGTDTTAVTLQWALLYMLYNPDVQKKVQQEIKEVLGNRYPSMKDRSNMPYTEATILEIQRKADVAPFAAYHQTTEDVEFQGFHIPSRTTIIPYLHSVHTDPKLFPNPDKFDPQHFLSSEGKVVNTEFLVAFSMGKRVCLGESMARMELFLFFTSILQRYTIKLPPRHKLPDDTGILGVVRYTHEYEVLLEPAS